MTKPSRFAIPLAVLLLCAVAVAPLIHADAPCTHDGAPHYFRIVAVRRALQDGILFSRWLPDLAFGYGYPFFNYRAALPYYLVLAFYMTGLALPVAFNLTYALSIVGSALAAYLLVRDLFGPAAGIVAAVAYAYAPYQFLDALLRGNLPESVALPLMPLIMWAFRRLALTGHRRWFLTSVVSLAALYLTHNISSLLFTPLLAAYLFVLWLVYRRDGHWVVAAGALALAMGLSAFFWGPALLEKEYVQLHMSHITRNNDFHNNFVPLVEVFALPAPVDTSLMNPPLRVHLGLVQVILGGVGLVLGFIRWRDPERRAMLIFSAFAAIVMIWMSTSASLWLWERIPLLCFVQFPWRFIGRAILPVALLTGALAPSQAQHTPRGAHHVSRFLFPMSIILLVFIAFPSTYPPQGYCPKSPHPTINDLFAYEHRSKMVGLAATGAFFPVWVAQRPTGSPLEEQYAAGGPIARFDESALPAGGFVVESDYGVNQARLVVETPVPFRARYLAFYFPGWRVTVDGEPVPVAPTDPDGLIAFDLPAGRHTATVRFGETPLRLTADVISLSSLALLLILLTSRVLRFTPHVSRPTSHASRLTFHVPRFTLYVLTAIILLAAKLAIVDRVDTIFRRPTLQPDGTLPGVEHALNQPYADGMTLIGYDQNRPTLPADGKLRLDLYWTARARPAARYQTVIHLVGQDGLRWSTPDSFRPRGYTDYPPTTTWVPGHYALDSHEVEPLPGTPPGDYDIVLTLFDRDTLSPLSALDAQGQPIAPTLKLGQVTVTRPRRPTELPQNNRIDLPMMDFILLSADLDRDQAAPGDSVYLTLMWHAIRDGNDGPSSRQCYQTLSLLSEDGSVVASYPLPLPVHSWQKGDVWRGQQRLLVPATLETGDYTWAVEWCSLGSHPVGQISVAAPPHTFTAPPVDANRSGWVEIDVRLGDIATLLEATCELADLQPGTPLTVTLVWRAEAETHTSYHVFLHLVGPDGALAAQSDGIPAGWTRPTTGWLPGEYITDVHTLTLPAGAPPGMYTLLAGLYEPDGPRLVAPDGRDAVQVAAIELAGQ